MRWLVNSFIGMQSALTAVGRTRAVFLVGLAMLAIATTSGRSADITIGSGFAIGAQGEVLTNAHVVQNCARISVRSSSGEAAAASLLARDEKNDLAVIRRQLPLSAVAAFREGPVRAGDVVVALGYPLSGLLATTANLTVGNVSALAGLSDDFALSSDQRAGTAGQ